MILCGFSPDECIDPVILLDKLPDLEGFEDVRYEIVYGNALTKNVPAQCTQTEDGYLIQIKDTVYMRADEKRSGGDRMHIMNEIMHTFADKLEFKPIFSRPTDEGCSRVSKARMDCHGSCGRSNDAV